MVGWQSYDTDGSEGAIMQRTFHPDAGGAGQASGAVQSIDVIIIPVPLPVVKGTSGDDVLLGKDISEVFRGRGGEDTITARGGNDWLYGGKGADLLVGGGGSDTFVFKTGYGNDRIRGLFEGDRIDLTDVETIEDFDDLIENHAFQIGGNVVINAGGGDTLVIDHAFLSLLDKEDFRFG